MSKTWKAAELTVCREYFHSERSGPVGKEGPDCTKDSYPWAVQMKHGLKFPQWLIKDMEQTIEDAWEGYIPVLILHPKGASYDDCLVVMRLGTFKEEIIDKLDKEE